ncbi:MAG: Tryptophan-rich protein TspO [Chlamydiia bacterium]|nr:Tryptophan-rich protein TspO [Chlamydiia bacterium]
MSDKIYPKGDIESMKDAKKSFIYALFIILSVGAGYLSSLVIETHPESYYTHLAKPSWTPPGYVFSTVWTILYILIGIGGGQIYLTRKQRPNPLATFYWFFQLILTFLWPFLFYTLQSPILGAIDITLLLIPIIGIIVVAIATAPWVSLIFGLYLLWICFAFILNWTIVFFNI